MKSSVSCLKIIILSCTIWKAVWRPCLSTRTWSFCCSTAINQLTRPPPLSVLLFVFLSFFLSLSLPFLFLNAKQPAYKFLAWIGTVIEGLYSLPGRNIYNFPTAPIPCIAGSYHFRFDDRRGGESYRPMNSNRTRRSPSRSYVRHARSPPQTRSPRLVADTWVPSTSRSYDRLRSRSPPALRRRSRSPSFYNRDFGPGSYRRARSPRRYSPRRDDRPRSPRQILWRQRSPYSGSRSRDISWGRNTSMRPRESSPPSQDFRFSRKERFTSSISDKYSRADAPPRRGISREYAPRTSIPPRGQSPFQVHREHQPDSAPKWRSTSPKGVSSTNFSAPVSGANSRRPSPLVDRRNLASFDPASPTTQLNSNGRFSNAPGHSSPGYERTFQTRYKSSGQNELRRSPTEEQTTSFAIKEQGQEKYDMSRDAAPHHLGSVHMNQANITSNIPTQPKAYGASLNQVPPSGPSYGSKSLPSHSRGSNICLLSAPTRPRGNLNPRDSVWTGASPRRGIIPQGPPSGPRGNNFMPQGSGSESINTYHRQNSIAHAGVCRSQRLTNHLAGLCSIVPGGKVFPPSFEISTEKRLSQLEVDKARLFDQVLLKQNSKRSGVRDWDRLDRESSISTLKSELAEGHLQRITGGESVHVGTIF